MPPLSDRNRSKVKRAILGVLEEYGKLTGREVATTCRILKKKREMYLSQIPLSRCRITSFLQELRKEGRIEYNNSRWGFKDE